MLQSPPIKRPLTLYSLFGLISIFTLGCTYNGIFDCYGFADDYAFLYLAQNESFYDIFAEFGRLMFGILAKTFFSKTDICGLESIRVISFGGVVLLSILLFRAYTLAGWEKIDSGCAALATCLMPAFGVYVAWAATFQIAYAIISAFIAGELCIKAQNTKCSDILKCKKTFLITVSVVMLTASLMLYQPAVTAFWLFPAIAVFVGSDKNERGLPVRESIYCIGIFAITMLLYFIFYKAKLWPFTVEASNRSGLTTEPLYKFYWFVQKPMIDSLSLSIILVEEKIRSAIACGVGIFIFIGWICQIKRIKRNSERLFFMCFFLLLLPLAYLPNLVVSQSWPAFRTQGVLGSVIIFYLFWSIKSVFHKVASDAIMIGLVMVFIVTAYNNVTYGFINPQKQELNLIKNALTKAMAQASKKLVLIRSHWKDSLSLRGRYDEYGLPSTYPKPVSERFLKVLLRETFSESDDIAIKSYKHDEKFIVGADETVIDAGKILREFKKQNLDS